MARNIVFECMVVFFKLLSYKNKKIPVFVLSVKLMENNTNEEKVTKKDEKCPPVT